MNTVRLAAVVALLVSGTALVIEFDPPAWTMSVATGSTWPRPCLVCSRTPTAWFAGSSGTSISIPARI